MYGFTALHSVVNIKKNDNCDIATLLLAHGAAVNTAGTNGLMPLHCAVDQGCRDFVTLLLAHGAAVDAPSPNGVPLLLALDTNTAAVPILLAYGADVNVRDDRGRTPLHLESAPFYRDYHITAKLLLAYGADVNAIDSDGRTPLHFLCGSPRSSDLDDRLFMAEFLLKNGADVNVISDDGCSPLQEAISNDSLSKEYRDRLATPLIANSADASVLNGADGE